MAGANTGGARAAARSGLAALGAWLARNRLVLATGLAASLPVIVSTIHAVSAGWLPLGDDAITAVRSYDVLSTHPPVLGPISTSSLLIGHPVLSPGPMLFVLLALPVRFGPLGPAIAMGVVNVGCVMGIVGLAGRRGGRALMFAAAACVAAMCASLDSYVWHDLWGPAATLLPFTLLFFLAWSVGCGEYRLLPLTVLVASFTIQSHLTYILPGAAILAVAAGFLAASRPRVPRRWLLGTLAVLVVCWAPPLAEEAAHRPGNMERIVQAARAVKQSYGAAGGLRSVAHAVGIPPWWLQGPRTPFARITEVSVDPVPFATVTALLVLVLLGVLAVASLRARRRDVAAAAVLALALMVSLFAVTASSPNHGPLFAVISYTIWWASPAGMFAWLVLGFGAATLLLGADRLAALRARVVAGPGRVRGAAAAAGLVTVAVIGALVAAGENRNRLEPLFKPARAVADRVRAGTPRGATVLITGDRGEIAVDLQSAVAYAMRRSGLSFVVSSLPGIGTRYDPARRPHDSVMTVTEHPPPGSRVLVREELVNVPADAPPGRRTFFVTLGR
jgi:hypothetical protein